MEDRRSPHRVTQRHLGESPTDGPPGATSDPSREDRSEPQPADRTPPPNAAIPAPDIPRGPSDLDLRERQRAWQKERARFEASRDSPPTERPSE